MSTNDFTDGYKKKVDDLVEGVKGDSAYQIAVQNGFEGTETEWLASLKGEKGNTGDTGGIESISQTLQGEQIIIENACSCNAHLRISGKTIQVEGTPTPASPIPIQNIRALNFTKQNEDGTVSETIAFPLAEGQILHEGDCIDEDGIHIQRGTIILTGTETWAQEGTTDTTNRFRLSNIGTNVASNKSTDKCSHFKYLSMYSADEEHVYVHNSGHLYVFVSKTRFATLEAFKTYLAQQYSSGTPVVVEYRKATETLIPFTEQQKIAYGKLRLMYEGYNKITCTDEIKPNMDITYYYNNDLNKTYAKRLDKVEKKIEKQNIVIGTEVETGRIIDGKKEYMKRLVTGNLTSGGEKTISTGLTNITQQRPATGIVQATGQANIDIPNSANSIRIYTRLSANGASLSIGNAGDLTAFSGFVDLYYTKN